MWLLHFFPDALIQFIVHSILILGILGCIITFQFANKVLMTWPPMAAYYRLAQIVSVLLLVSGIYFEGGYSSEMAWRERVREMEARVAKAEEESHDANEKLDKLGEQKIKVIQGKQIVVKQYIDREITKYDATCPIPREVVKAHNAAAKNEGIK